MTSTATRTLRRCSLAAAAVLVLGACSQTADEADETAPPATESDAAEPAATDADETAPGTEAPVETDAAGGEADDSVDAEETEPAGPPPAGADTPGVTDEAVTVSFVIVDTSKVAAAFGWELPDEGDREAQLQALVDHTNANGGIGGRELDAKVHIYDAITDGPIAEEKLCNAITQDDDAFAAVLGGQFQENARPCYANANTMMLDTTLYPIGGPAYDELSPYLWSPFLPSYDDVVAGLADQLVATDWFEGATVGVIAIENDLSQRAYEEELLPRLTDAGVEVVSYNTIDPTDGQSFDNDQLQAIVNFKEAGVSHVIAIGGSRLVSWFIDTAQTQNFGATYAMTSYDSPDFTVFNYPEELSGAAGISVLPGYDIADDQYGFPANAAEQACLDVLDAAGLPYEERVNVRTALSFCDAIRLLQTAAAEADEMSAAGLSEAMWSVGDGFESASVYSVEYSEDAYAGGASYLPIAFDEGCQCFAVTGPATPFES